MVTLAQQVSGSQFFLVVSVSSLLVSLIYFFLFQGEKYDPLEPLKNLKPVAASKAQNKNRKPGTWTPENFTVSKPKLYPDWDINTTKPLPYRAFKHKYHVNMGIRNMEFDDWIQLDNEWMKYHDEKLKRIADKNELVYGTLPELYPAALELLDLFKSYLPARYPTLFKETEKGIYNLVTKEDFDFKSRPLPEDPMLMASKLIQDDIAIMVEMPDGQFYLKGGAIMLAGFWRLKDKLNLPLSLIHTTGDVPKYNTHLKSGMEKFFTRQTPDKPVVRNNYFIQTDDKLAWSESIGDENTDQVGWYTAPKLQDINKIFFRSERQSVRKLPLTGLVFFTVRTYFHPITDLCKEPYIPRRLLDGIASWSEDVKEYRGLHAFEDVLMPYLREKAEEQELQGFTIENEPQSYPY